MHDKLSLKTGHNEPGIFTNTAGLKLVAGAAVGATCIALFFWIAGGPDWIRGWSYVGLLTAGQSLSTAYIWRKNPELLVRRSRIGEGTKSWDKILLGLFGLAYLGILIVAALDERYTWSEMSEYLWMLGCILYAFFPFFITWVMAVNPYFEKTVRIQSDRGHRVIDSGPYRIIRHPGYLATILGFILPGPLLLGSWWAFIPAFLATLCLAVRTGLEDKTLRRELPEYETYTQRVRYRLVPGVW